MKIPILLAGLAYASTALATTETDACSKSNKCLRALESYPNDASSFCDNNYSHGNGEHFKHCKNAKEAKAACECFYPKKAKTTKTVTKFATTTVVTTTTSTETDVTTVSTTTTATATSFCFPPGGPCTVEDFVRVCCPDPNTGVRTCVFDSGQSVGSCDFDTVAAVPAATAASVVRG